MHRKVVNELFLAILQPFLVLFVVKWCCKKRGRGKEGEKGNARSLRRQRGASAKRREDDGGASP
jgi:hypothetical protein